MIAISIKKTTANQLTHLALQAGQVHKDFDASHLSEQDRADIKSDYCKEFEAELKTIIVNLLNISLGGSDDTEVFWDRLKSQCFYDFNYKFSQRLNKKTLPTGLLVAACSYHLGIQLKDKRYQLFDDAVLDPFQLADIMKFNVQVDTLSYSKHKIMHLVSLSDKFKSMGQFTVAKRLIQIRMELDDHLSKPLDYCNSLAELADIYLSEGEFEKAIDSCKRALSRFGYFNPKSIRFTIIMLKAWIVLEKDANLHESFNLNISLISYNFGAYHPLYSTCSSFLAYSSLTQLLLLQSRLLREVSRILPKEPQRRATNHRSRPRLDWPAERRHRNCASAHQPARRSHSVHGKSVRNIQLDETRSHLITRMKASIKQSWETE